VQADPKDSTFERHQRDGTSDTEIEMQIVAVCCELCPWRLCVRTTTITHKPR